MSSGGLRNTSLSSRDQVNTSHKPLYLTLYPPLLIHIVELNPYGIALEKLFLHQLVIYREKNIALV